MEVFTRQMGLYDRFAPGAALLFVSFDGAAAGNRMGRPMTYSLYINHGSGGEERKEPRRSVWRI